MSKGNIVVLALIIVVFGFGLWVLLPLQGERLGRTGLHLGLDLVGGVHLVYEADFKDVDPDDQSAVMERALITIQNRIDKYGVAEPVIQQVGNDRIMVQLPGFTDIDAAKSLVQQTGFLEFREVEFKPDGNPATLADYLGQTDLQFYETGDIDDRVFVGQNDLGKDETYGFLKYEDGAYHFEDAAGNTVAADALSAYGASVAWVKARGDSGTPLTGDLLADAYLTTTQSGQLQIAIEWDDTGTVIFDQIAARLYDPLGTSGAYTLKHVLGIFLDNTLLSAPKVNSSKFEGKGVISGSFTLAEAEELTNLLKSGSLPMPLKQPPLFEEKVSATLGARFVEMSWLAGLIGIILVMVFMLAYYRLPGLVASLALVFYGVIMLTLFKLIPVTLSLAGIGGFIVSIGMAVDANVLIFERLKEELRSGRTLGAAIETGFKRAWSAIWDSNVTTVIVCIILYWLGSSIVASAPVMGFALTLGIGVVVSMFTAVVVTRTLLRFVIHGGMVRHLAWFNVYRGKQ